MHRHTEQGEERGEGTVAEATTHRAGGGEERGDGGRGPGVAPTGERAGLPVPGCGEAEFQAPLSTAGQVSWGKGRPEHLGEVSVGEGQSASLSVNTEYIYRQHACKCININLEGGHG